MAGIREKKKKRTQNEILDAANRLFSKKGYTETTIEEIAELAEVGVGTVYNYFSSKGGLLVAYMAQETDQIHRTGLKILSNPGKSPEKAVNKLLETYSKGFFKFDRNLLKEMFVLSFSQPGAMVDDFLQQDMILIRQITELLLKFQETGKIAKDLPADQAAMILYSNFGVILMFNLGGLLDDKTVMKQIEISTNLIFRNWKAERE